MSRQAGPPALEHGRRMVVALLCAATGLVGLPASASAAARPKPAPVWVTAWSVSPQGRLPSLPAGPGPVTVRDVVHPSLGGSALRVELTNRFGVAPLVVTEVSVGASGQNGGVVPGTLRLATFQHHLGTVVAPGADAASDPIPLVTAAAQDLSVSVAVTSDDAGVSGNDDARQVSYAGTGNLATELPSAGFQGIVNWAWLRAVDVLHGPPAHTVVAFGDSLTTGYQSTIDANARYPDRLADLLNAHPSNDIAVANAGIGGNMLLSAFIGPSGVSRFGVDALGRAGVKTIIVLMGVNDLNSGMPSPVDAAQVEAGYGALLAAAHRVGVRVLGSTLLPYEGASVWTPEREAQRESLNMWIHQSRAFDVALDLASVVADPGDPARLQARFDSGDHLHLSDAGYAAIARAIPLLAL